MTIRKNRLLPALSLALACFMLPSCDDEVDNADTTDWEKSVSQTFDGVEFTLTPGRLTGDAAGGFGFEPCLEFAEGEDVWFELSVANGSAETVTLEKAEFDGCIDIFNMYGEWTATISTSPGEDLENVEDAGSPDRIIVAPGGRSSGLNLGVSHHCWPGSKEGTLIDYGYWTEDKTLAGRDLYRAMIRRPATLRFGEEGETPRLLEADFSLAISFVVK